MKAKSKGDGMKTIKIRYNGKGKLFKAGSFAGAPGGMSGDKKREILLGDSENEVNVPAAYKNEFNPETVTMVKDKQVVKKAKAPEPESTEKIEKKVEEGNAKAEK